MRVRWEWGALRGVTRAGGRRAGRGIAGLRGRTAKVSRDLGRVTHVFGYEAPHVLGLGEEVLERAVDYFVLVRLGGGGVRGGGGVGGSSNRGGR